MRYIYTPGPNITAFQSMMLSGHGLPEMPPGGSLESRLKSRMRRLLQLVDFERVLLMKSRMNAAETDHFESKGDRWITRMIDFLVTNRVAEVRR